MDKGTKILLFIIAIAAIYIVYKSLFPVAKADFIGPFKIVEGNWLEGWTFRVPVGIGPNAGNTTENTVGLIVINTKELIDKGLMKEDCSDIRVTDSDGVTLLKFWVQPDTCYGETTLIYVRLPIVESRETKRLYVYFGNNEAKSASNGYEVFDFFDDFEGEEIDLNKWTISPGTAYDRIYVTAGKLYVESDGVAPVKTIATREKVFKPGSAAIIRIAPVYVRYYDNYGIAFVSNLSEDSQGIFFGFFRDTYVIILRAYGVSAGSYASYGDVFVEMGTRAPYFNMLLLHEGSSISIATIGQRRTYTLPVADSLHIMFPRGIWDDYASDEGVIAVDFVAIINNYNPSLFGVIPKAIIPEIEIRKDTFYVDVQSPKRDIYFTNDIPLKFRILSGQDGVVEIYVNNKKQPTYTMTGGILREIALHETLKDLITNRGKHTIRFVFRSGDTIREYTHEFIYGIPGLYGDPKYRYRIPIVIEERSGNDLENIVIPLRISLGSYINSGMMRSDCLDIMFTDYDGYTRIPFWVERCSDKDWRIQVGQVEIETKAYYSIGTTDLELRDNVNFPETPISYGDNYYNTYDPWTCDYCNMYIRVYLKYYSSDGTGPLEAFVKIRSDDNQTIWVNGKLVGYGPTGTKAYNITSYIVPGDNEIWIWCKEYRGDEYCFFDFIIDGIYINRDGVHTKRVEKIEEEGSLIWVRIPRIAARNNHTIYMYFGSDYLFVGDPHKVFDIYENFSLKTVLDGWDVYTRETYVSMPPYSVELTGGALRVYVADDRDRYGFVSVAHRKAVELCNKKVEFEAKFLPNNPAYALPYGRLYFIGLAEQPLEYERFINSIGFLSTEWFSDNIIRTGEKIIWGESYYRVGDNPTSIKVITDIRLIVNAIPYLLGKTIQETRYLIDLKITDKKIESMWYIADGKEFYQGAYSEIGTSKCTILARPTIIAGTWSAVRVNPAEIYLYWIRVYNYYEPEPIVYQLGIGENPKYIPTEEETYEETVLEYIQQQEQQAQQPPTYQPPTHQPPTYQPPTQQPPTYQPPIYQPPIYIPPEYQPIMEYPGEQIIVQ
ncbi:MAG: DUF2341 domain-containing protein, partial [Nanopusillaceae archaeon]